MNQHQVIEQTLNIYPQISFGPGNMFSVSNIEFPFEALHELIIYLNRSIKNHTFETGDHCNFCPSKIHCIKMIEPIDNDDLIVQRVKNKKYIKKMLDDSENKLYDERPSWFVNKKWGKGMRRIFVGEMKK